MTINGDSRGAIWAFTRTLEIGTIFYVKLLLADRNILWTLLLEEEVAADGSHKQILHCEDQRLNQPTDHQITSAPWGMRAGGWLETLGIICRSSVTIGWPSCDCTRLHPWLVSRPRTAQLWSKSPLSPGNKELRAEGDERSCTNVSKDQTFWKAGCKPTHQTASANYLQSTNAGLL